MTPWTAACQAPLSVHGILWAEYWGGLPFPPPGDLPNPGIKSRSPALQADSLLIELSGKPLFMCCWCYVASVVSNSVWPHRWQPTRLRHPWDSPGKNTGVGCHFLLQCMKVKNESECVTYPEIILKNLRVIIRKNRNSLHFSALYSPLWHRLLMVQQILCPFLHCNRMVAAGDWPAVLHFPASFAGQVVALLYYISQPPLQGRWLTCCTTFPSLLCN